MKIKRKDLIAVLIVDLTSYFIVFTALLIITNYNHVSEQHDGVSFLNESTV